MSEHEEKKFTSKIVRTTNVAKELVLIANEYKVDVASLDFHLIKSELYIQMPTAKEGEANDFIEVVTDEDKAYLQDKALLTDPRFLIKQVYDIEITSEKESHAFDDLIMNVSGNKSLTSAYAIFKAGSSIKKSNDCAKDLLTYINKRKLRARLLIDLWDEEMLSNIAGLAAKIEVNNVLTFEEDLQILVIKSLNSIPTVHDKMILHFEEKALQEERDGHVDYKARGFITSVEVGELLMTYIKPKMGENGRNCRGEFVEVPAPNVSHEAKFAIDSESIEIKESDDKIEYLSQKNGYVAFESNTYLVKDSLEVSEISFKSTGNVNAGLNGDIAIHVKEKDSLKDAIGMGVEVEASEIVVEGNVGSNSTVRAQTIHIGGQTHKSSKLFADHIKINLHRGFAKGANVEVKRLEQGRIEGDTVFVEQAAGGEIYGKDVRIELLQSHCKVYASHSIEIQKMKSGENVLSIDQTRMSGNSEAIMSLDKQIDDARININTTLKKAQEQEALLLENKETILDIKKRLLSYQSSGVKLPQSFVEKYKQFQNLQKEISLLQSDHRLAIDLYETLKTRRAEFQTDILEAKIINHDMWRGHNEVRFKLTYPDIEIVEVPKEGVRESVITLRYDQEEDEYTLQTKTL